MFLDLCITEKHLCLKGQFRCDSNMCLSKEKLCNDVADCKDESDEDPTLCTSPLMLFSVICHVQLETNLEKQLGKVSL